ncbi:MAG: heme-binding protein [Pseudorhodobacter sp.]
MDHAKQKGLVEKDEAWLAGLYLDNARLIAVANRLMDLAPAALAARIVMGRRVVAHLSDAGTGQDNEHFLNLKINTVFNCGHSSLWWFHHLRTTGRTLAEVTWADPRQVIDMGGGVPLYSNHQIAGAIAVSGLAHDADHALIMSAVRSVVEEALPT